jgi:hypothetical protein
MYLMIDGVMLVITCNICKRVPLPTPEGPHTININGWLASGLTRGLANLTCMERRIDADFASSLVILVVAVAAVGDTVSIVNGDDVAYAAPSPATVTAGVG